MNTSLRVVAAVALTLLNHVGLLEPVTANLGFSAVALSIKGVGSALFIFARFITYGLFCYLLSENAFEISAEFNAIACIMFISVVVELCIIILVAVKTSERCIKWTLLGVMICWSLVGISSVYGIDLTPLLNVLNPLVPNVLVAVLCYEDFKRSTLRGSNVYSHMDS